MSSGEKSALLEEIQRVNSEAALVLKTAEICTDSEIQSLSEADLNELFPGIRRLKLRATVFDIIQKRELINLPPRDLQSFLPDGNFSDALSSSKTLADHLPVLKAWKNDLDKLLSFLEAHIKLVENLIIAQRGQMPSRGADKMCALLDEVWSVNPEAAHTLRGVALCTDIRLLTQQDLLELFPEHEKFHLRKTIFGIIQKQKPTYVFSQKPTLFYPEGNLRDVLCSSQTLVDNPSILKAWKDEIATWHSFLSAHIKLVEDTIKAQPDQKPDRGEMGSSMEKIDRINQDAAHVRKDAPSSSQTLDDHLHILKAWKDKVDKWPIFLKDHMKLVAKTIKAQQHQKAGRGVLPGSSSSLSCSPVETNTSADFHPNRAQGLGGEEKTKSSKRDKQSNSQTEQQKSNADSVLGFLSLPFLGKASFRTNWSPSTEKILKYKMVVSGETFNAHNQLMDEVKSSTQEFKLVNMDGSQNSEVPQFIIVFCPVVSRIGTDINEAMMAVKGNEPVFLVLMHHVYEAKHVATAKAKDNYNIVLYANVFYHETVKGLLSCSQNTNAVCEMRNKIIEMFKGK